VKALTPTNVLTKVAEAGVFFATFLPVKAFAADCDPKTSNINDAAQCAQATNSQPSSLFGNGGIFQTISNILIFLIGAIAVIMLIYGGLQYVISSGDSKRVESAKNTILYAIIGIVVAILAYAIVGFVTGALSPGGSATQ
jgi:hypothetical protein